MAIPGSARNANDTKGFDGDAFYRALETTVQARDVNWKEVSEATGVSASTLTRMAQGRRPDAASLAALSAWAGLNPSDFVNAPYRASQPEPMMQISSLLRADPALDTEAAEAVEAIVRAAYERLKKPLK
ncbi:helix-turn-helix domain-containing protein [Bradyrhizobium sp. sBnM-33]|uniref:helix-turn-helix domain-containing protein n=1 Tax=Bradyrhizobium sp. sBnM-33 TaxID=2831780 RepID=UPI001BCC719A|nr:helix-turn-helix domain-containing protein [Bradyrhizobium sp. sBnM-33]WOH52737.1 helix-turn-helix domain-containing protein [Bradyrhizobium sp. sBnM-33]